jgi:hypothetical protein
MLGASEEASMKVLLIAAGALALAASTPAPAAPGPGPGCFYIRDVGGRSVVDPNTVYFGVLDRSHMTTQAYFRVRISGCHVIPGSHSRSSAAGVFRVRTVFDAAGASDKVCSINDLKIEAGTTCQVESLERMTPAEVAAIPRHLKPTR